MIPKYTKNERMFETIDTEDKAYWLGFLAADGHVSDDGRLHLKLSTNDIGHLEKYKKFAEYNGPIEIRECLLGKNIRRFGKKQKYKTALLRISSRKICADLRRYNIIPRKSLVLEFPNCLSDNLVPHYLRGYIDGDGCWYVNDRKYNDATLAILSTESFLNRIQDILFGRNLIERIYKLKRPSKIYKLEIRGRRLTSKIAEWLYSNSTIFLDRKRKYLIENGVIASDGSAIVKTRNPYFRESNPNAKKYTFVSPSGEKFEVFGRLKMFCEEHEIPYGKAIKVGNGLLDNIRGWKIEKRLDKHSPCVILAS
jgi:hypothetical protein